MPADLRKAHHALDKAVEKCYRKEKFAHDEARLSYLFECYQALEPIRRWGIEAKMRYFEAGFSVF